MRPLLWHSRIWARVHTYEGSPIVMRPYGYWELHPFLWHSRVRARAHTAEGNPTFMRPCYSWELCAPYPWQRLAERVVAVEQCALACMPSFS